MPVPVFPPKKDADLLAWSKNFDTRITATPTSFGLDAAQATAYHALHAVYAAAYALAKNPNTNSKANVNAKNIARENLMYGSGGARELVNIVQAHPGTTDEMRSQLGLPQPDRHRSPIAAPTTAPDISIISTIGRTINVRLYDQDSTENRGKPVGLQGATILYNVGDSPPADSALWYFALNTSKTVFDVEIPAVIEAGSKIWLAAFWFNARKEASPLSSPEYARVGDGLAIAA